ncbi:P-loop containing nucleoside triphosphate hydrolase protein [Paraphaeosphaeria sporulosa]|uniref:p-loop containing nucleoside triphosphate hydrolase protein n=1 Tax=Paraphaeosphaeria sporulosa TaxID=1460663 RepID=A0A177CFK2_9PLEO|nr:P-loop containing nucleoside triphosphate hydrolase protein [Paraphaeosphaeria sporulosa]OAG06384.1 P-loop containing nucleoside triphosphate hydrolase protein [Paraphaeosphaeria sporulosa]
MNDSSECLLSADAAFGPSVQAPCRDGFDFTFTFEQYFFTVAPCALLLILSVPRLYSLSRSKPKVDGKALKVAKLTAILALSCLQLATLVLWATDTQLRARTPALVGSAFAFIAFLLSCPLSYLEHTRAIRPSALLNIYLFVTLFFDAAVLRTLWLMPSLASSICEIYTALFAIKVALMFLEAQEKAKYDDAKEINPEAFSGIYSQGLFWWLNKLIWAGAKHLLSPADLYSVSSDMTSEVLGSNLWDRWTDNEQDIKSGNPKLVCVVFSALKWQIMAPVLPRLAQVAFTLCQPVLLRRLLKYLADDEQNPNIGYGLIGAYGVVYIGMAITNALYWHHQLRFLVMLRGSMITTVFRKATDLSLGQFDPAESVTLMSTDVERVNRGLLDMHDFWANIVQVAVATWLIKVELGVAAVAPIAVALATLGVTMWLSSFTTKFQMAWLGKIQGRIGLASSVLSSMKIIKILGLSTKVGRKLEQARIDEIQTAGKFRLISVLSASMANVPMLISPVITFVIFIATAKAHHTTLDPSKLFTSLSLLILLSEPLFGLFAGLIDLMSAIGCFARIEKYLLTPSRSEHRNFTTVGERSSDSSERALTPIASKASNGANEAMDNAMVRIRNGNFGWKVDGEPTLRDINMTIAKNQLIAIVGPVGSGKSTLLKAILGETPYYEGDMHVSNPNIAWCEQESWLINGTVQRNIIGFSSFDVTLYNEIIWCCDLHSDLVALPKGDQTKIGSKGLSLSGGQRQRIAIARALYSGRDFFIFDDIFSMLDMSTQNKIFSRVLGPNGLMRKRRATAVLATHAERFLRYADHIIVLSSKGTISEQGSFADLSKAGGYVAPSAKVNSSESSVNTVSGDADPKVDFASSDATVADDTAPLDKARQIGDFKVYRYYFSFLSWKIGFMFLVLQVSYAFLNTFPTVWLKWWTDANDQSTHDRSALYVGVYAAFQISALVASASVTWWSFNVMAVQTGLKLHDIVVKTVMAAPLTFFSTTDSGDTLTRFSQDFQLLDMSLPLALMVVVTNALICMAQIALIATASAWISLSFPFLFAVFYFVQKYYLRTSRQMRLLDIEQKAPLYTQFGETLEGLATIRAYSWTQHTIEHSNKLVDNSQKPYYLMYAIQRWLSLVLDLIIAALATLVVGIAIALRDAISPGFTGVSLTQLISFSSYLKLMIMFWTQMETSIGAVARIKRFGEQTASEHDSDVQDPPQDWPSRGEVSITDVTAKYAPDKDATALSNISLTIRPGEKIGIVGRTGSGKSSLILTLFRMLDVSSGSITIDGLDISTLKPEGVRRQIVGVTEAPFIMPGTVKENLDPYAEANDESLTSALKKVGLWDTVESIGGLEADTEALKLSVGQRQLFNIAGALVRKAGKILIMDEATSSIDEATDKIVQRAIREEFKDRTVIYVAHRLDAILDFDRVAVMDKGSLAEIDEPKKLLARETMFRALYNASSKGNRVASEGDGIDIDQIKTH